MWIITRFGYRHEGEAFFVFRFRRFSCEQVSQPGTNVASKEILPVPER
jgi:hypothetical protein